MSIHPRWNERTYPLSPLSDVAERGGTLVATGREPWLELRGIAIEALRGRFIELTYRCSLLDQPARPLVRFDLDDGTATERIGAAAIAGAGLWVGRVPRTARRIALSPTDQLGPFGFRVEGVKVRRWPRLLLAGLRGRPRQTRSAFLTRLIGWTPESDNNLSWAIGATDFDRYGAWAKPRLRSAEPASLDRPRHDWSTAAPVVLILAAADPRSLRRSLASLQAQHFANWQAWVLAPADAERDDNDPRIVRLDDESAAERLGTLPAGALVALLGSGDILPPYALAFLAEQRLLHPGVGLFYGDEVAAGRPILKPGWSPRLSAARPYLGRAVFVGGAADWSAQERRAFVARRETPARFLADGDAVRPLRRVLLSSRSEAPVAAIAAPALPGLWRRAAIIIPSCDHPALLRRIVASIRLCTPPASYRLVVVDNGRAAEPADRLPDGVAGADDVLLLRRTGCFNFSRFCNEAAAACDEELLVFLNDDMEVLSPGWLARLAALAFEPGVGAVGAKLTFPDGRLQHVGVLVGMGGSAGHLGAMAAADDPGWLGRNTVPHEVSAVTGACLAVARDKFDAVGGFDAEHLPVELSDIDLCLKLNARGWQTMMEPNVRLLHEESASRGGATFRRLGKYSRQREVFVERWRHVLRDDPAFHPGLSLYSLAPALG